MPTNSNLTDAEQSYEDLQYSRNSKYKSEWDKAPEAWKKKVAELGIAPECSMTTASIEIHDNTTASYTPDMAETLDTHIDFIVETLGFQHEKIIRATAEMLMRPIEAEIERGRSMTLGRVACFMVKANRRDVQARVHQLLHAIPRLAEANGYSSMRASARACGCSQEWIKRGRDEWCNLLQIPVPVEGTKSALAKLRYKLSGKTKHWRNRKFLLKPIQPTKPTPCQTPISNSP